MKYEFSGARDARGLYQIRALRDIPCWAVKKGDLGGWIVSEANLSQEGDCWVSGEAMILDNAKVLGNAGVYGNALVYDNARIDGNAQVGGRALVYGSAWVYDSAHIRGTARVHGNARFGGTWRLGDGDYTGTAREAGPVDAALLRGTDSGLITEGTLLRAAGINLERERDLAREESQRKVRAMRLAQEAGRSLAKVAVKGPEAMTPEDQERAKTLIGVDAFRRATEVPVSELLGDEDVEARTPLELDQEEAATKQRQAYEAMKAIEADYGLKLEDLKGLGEKVKAMVQPFLTPRAPENEFSGLTQLGFGEPMAPVAVERLDTVASETNDPDPDERSCQIAFVKQATAEGIDLGQYDPEEVAKFYRRWRPVYLAERKRQAGSPTEAPVSPSVSSPPTPAVLEQVNAGLLARLRQQEATIKALEAQSRSARAEGPAPRLVDPVPDIDSLAPPPVRKIDWDLD